MSKQNKKVKEIELNEFGMLVFKHKTNKRLFLQRTYRWVDDIALIDETEDRQHIDSWKYSTFNLDAWTPMTVEEYSRVKSKYREIYGLNLSLMEEQLDKALESETKETLEDWLNKNNQFQNG